MEITFIPALETQRKLLDIPRGWDRFQEYLRELTGGTDDIVLPIVGFNPMGKPHVAALLDYLLGIKAGETAKQAVRDAVEKLKKEEGSYRLCLCLCDDLKGGWTNRYTTELDQCLRLEPLLKRRWIVPLLWSSEKPGKKEIQRTVLRTIYRSFYFSQHGPPKTLRDLLRQEGWAHHRIGEPPAATPGLWRKLLREIGPHLESSDYVTIFTCWFGDEAAASLGYTGLGISPFAGKICAPFFSEP